MTNERIVDRWVYPMDSSCTPYNETDFNDQVKKLCQDEVNYITNHSYSDNSTNQASQQQTGKDKLTKLEPLKNCLRIAKCNVVGDQSVGKTCLVNRFGYDVFASNSKATIGIDFDVQKFFILNRPFTLQIWDTAGDERFRSITRAYYRGAHAALIVFDLTMIKSFQNVTLWYNEILESACSPDHNNGTLTLRCKMSDNADSFVHEQKRPFLFLVGTKKDLISEDALAFYRQEGAKLANKIGAEFWMVSSNTGENVVDLFKRVACLCFDYYLLKELRIQQERIDAEHQRILRNTSKPNDSNLKWSEECRLEGEKSSVHYSPKNGGQIVFYYQDEKRKKKNVKKDVRNLRNYPRTIWPCFVEWWSQWFGQHGKIRRRIGHVTSNKVTASDNTTKQHELKKKNRKNKTFQCFRFTCMVSVD